MGGPSLSYDGKGYPHWLKGNSIPLEAQIVSAADICDALTMDRPYRRWLGSEELIRISTNMKGRNLDPPLIDTLFTILAVGTDN